MNQMTEQSTCKPDWPLNAVPRSWVEALFSKMSAFYGNKFAVMWRGSNVEEVQKAWAIELNRLSREQIKAGTDQLVDLTDAPTLPQFIAHCKRARLEQHNAPQLTDQTRASPEVVAENLERIKGIVGGLAGSKIVE